MSKREDTEKNKEGQEENILTEENLDMDSDDAFRI